MSGRIFALSTYLFRSLLVSLAGLLYILLALAFYLVLFDPRQLTPDVDYYILVIGIFGICFSFLVSLSVAARANKAIHFPLIVRLPSRIEYLTPVFLASLGYATLIQIAIALLALIANGPALSLEQLATIPPIWITGNILFILLSLHASDLVAKGWSRVYIFGIIGILLYLQSGLDLIRGWLANLFSRVGNQLLISGMDSIATIAFDISDWLTETGSTILGGVLGLIFWPFQATADAIINGYFDPMQALAPAILLIYACFLFILAANLFAKKDLHLTE